ncbi:DegT/DnrJ/EryC1/StrS family aminotransferase [Litorivivens sp.]|uniref:DegT/DnrJ/EryC1/StrS family aminotransferase n=1 Tax=Litorivivens sp. TaxID=2020868 RepID=UPI00356987D9
MLPLATTTWDDEEIAALQEVIASGMFTMGDQVSQFESRFASYVGSRYAVMVNSGSSANLLGVAAVCYLKDRGLKPGDEVIVPAVSWPTTYYPLHQYGLKLKFIDIDRATLNLDLSVLEGAISNKTRAIFAVNLLGNAVDYQRLHQIVAGRDILLFEDNCEALGATLNGKQAGTFGLFGTYSFFFSHHISTMEGGMVVTDDEELYHCLLSMRSHGWTRHLPKDNLICEKGDDPFYESFRFVLPGYNIRPIEMSGALGLRQLEKLPSIIEGRRKNAEYFVERFSKIAQIGIQREIGESSWFGFAVVASGGKKVRDALVRSLHAMKVDCRPIVAGNFVRNPVVEHMDYEVFGALSNSDEVTDCGFFFGNHHFDITDQLNEVAIELERVLGE